MSKVLILSSSPRKNGNSDLLCQAFARGALEAGHDVTTIRVAEKKIGYCTGCYACHELKHCVQKDDASAVLASMMAADVLVLASPVYFYSVCGQLKTLFDRTVAIFPNLTNKRFVFIMTMADTDATMAQGTIQAMQGFLDCYDGSKREAVLVAPGVHEKGEVLKTPYAEEAYRLGRTLQ